MTQALPIIQLTAVNDFATNVARSGQSHVTIYGELLIQQETVNGQLGLQVERPISVFTALVTTPDGQQAIASLTVVQGKPHQTFNGRPFPDEDADTAGQLAEQQQRHTQLLEDLIGRIHAIDPLLSVETYSGAVYTPPDMRRLTADWSPVVDAVQ